MTAHKVFVSEHDEQKWLNRMGAKGFVLVGKKCGRYEFEKADVKAEYIVDYLDDSPKTPDNTEYLRGKDVCGFKGNSAYIRNGVHTAAPLGRQAARYGKLSVFFGAVTALFAALFAYNLKYVNYFNEIEYVVPANKDEILPIFNFVVGKNPAALFMWVVALFLVAAAIFTVIWLREWALWNGDYKAAAAAEKQAVDDGGEAESQEQ